MPVESAFLRRRDRRRSGGGSSRSHHALALRRTADRQAIEGAIEELKKANAGTDVTAISKAMDQLTQAQHRAAESLYKQTQGGGGQEPGGGGAPRGDGGTSSSGQAKDEVIDAEVVDEK